MKLKSPISLSPASSTRRQRCMVIRITLRSAVDQCQIGVAWLSSRSMMSIATSCPFTNAGMDVKTRLFGLVQSLCPTPPGKYEKSSRAVTGPPDRLKQIRTIHFSFLGAGNCMNERARSIQFPAHHLEIERNPLRPRVTSEGRPFAPEMSSNPSQGISNLYHNEARS